MHCQYRHCYLTGQDYLAAYSKKYCGNSGHFEKTVKGKASGVCYERDRVAGKRPVYPDAGKQAVGEWRSVYAVGWVNDQPAMTSSCTASLRLAPSILVKIPFSRTNLPSK